MKKMNLFYCLVLAAMMMFANNVQAQTSWESVVLEDAFGDDRTAQADVVQGGGVGNLYLKGVTAGSGIRETFIKLSLDDLDNLAGVMLDDAKVELRLYTGRTNADAAQNQISVYPVANTWDETTLTWNNSRTIQAAALALPAIASGQGVRVAGYSGSGQQGDIVTDAYNAANVSLFDISAYAIEQYKAGNKTISVLLHVTNNVGNGDQQLASKDLAATAADHALKLPKVIVTEPTATADFTTPAIGFKDTALQFTNTSKLATSYAWDFGDGNTSTDENPTHTYTATGNYTVGLTINGSAELIQTKSINIYNLSNETIVGGNMELADKDSWGIIGESTFAASGATGVTTWGDTSPTGFGTSGYLSVTGGAGTAAIQYYIWQAVQLEAGGIYDFSMDWAEGVYNRHWYQVFIGTVVPGGADYSDNQVGSLMPSWVTEDANLGYTPNTFTHQYTPTSSGVYYFVIKFGCNPGGGKMEAMLDNVKLEKVLDPIPAFTASSFGFAGVPVSFTNTSANATSYSWDFGDGNTSTDENPSHAYTAVGEYTVTLAATGSSTASITKTVKILGVSDETILGGSMEAADRQHWGETGGVSTGTNSQHIWGDLPNAERTESYKPAGFETAGFLTVAEDWSGNIAYKIFQAVNLTAEAIYDISFDYAVGSHRRTWLEVYLDTTIPGAGDYTTGRLGDGLIPWSADYSGSGGNTLEKFEEAYTATTTGVHYFVIKWGCGSGDNGYFNTSMDNITLVRRTTSANAALDASSKVYADNGRVFVQSAQTSNKIAVYNTSGQLILSDSFSSERYESKLLVPGLYIVNVNNEVHKLSVR